MRRPIGKQITLICQHSQIPSKIGEIAFLMGFVEDITYIRNLMPRAIRLGLIHKSGTRLKAVYQAYPDWRERIKAHNAKPQAHEIPGYVKPVKYTPMRVNSIFNMGAMQ